MEQGVDTEEGDAFPLGEGHYRAIVRTFMDGFWIVDSQGRFLEVNDSYCRLTGYCREELLSMHVSDLEAAEKQEDAIARLQKVREAGAERFVTRHRCKNDRMVDVEVSVACTNSDQGMFCGLTRDITERKRTEEQLKESEERYRKLLGEVTDYIYIVQVDKGRPVRTIHGPGCVAVTGYISDEYDSDPLLWIKMVPEEDRNAVREQAVRTLSGEAVLTLEHRIIHKDGSIRWVRNTTVPRYDDQGRFFAYDGLIADITARKRDTEDLRRSEKEIRYITSSLGEGVYVLNEEGHVVFMNPEAKHLLGWTEAELLNKNIHDVIHSHKADGTPLPFDDCTVHKVYQTGDRYFSDDEVFKRKDGTIFPVSVTSTPLMAEDKIVGSVTVFRDITQRKQMEAEREELIAELQQALSKVKTLSGLLPICSSCKKIRDDKGYWNQIEAYISEHSEADFSHGLCPDCAKKIYPQYYEKIWGKEEK